MRWPSCDRTTKSALFWRPHHRFKKAKLSVLISERRMQECHAEDLMRILVAYDGSAYATAAIDDLRRAGLPRQTEAMVVSVAHRGWPEASADSDEGQFGNPWKATMKEAEALAEEGRKRIPISVSGLVGFQRSSLGRSRKVSFEDNRGLEAPIW